jgi:hypothetical protein
MGKRFTGGAVVRKNCDDLTGAREFIDSHKDQRKDTGGETYTLTGPQLAEAKDAFKRLKGTGLSLSKAVTNALARWRRPEEALSWAEALKRYLHRPTRPLAENTAAAYRNSINLLSKDMGKVLSHQAEKKTSRIFSSIRIGSGSLQQSDITCETSQVFLTGWSNGST